MSIESIEFRVTGGMGRVWEARPGHWAWAHPNGSQGEETSCDQAMAAVEAVESPSPVAGHTPITDKYRVDHIGFYSCATVPASVCADIEAAHGKLLRQRDQLKAKLLELAEATHAVCGPMFTASDGGAMWCSMRQRPGATKAVERLRAALASVQPEEGV